MVKLIYIFARIAVIIQNFGKARFYLMNNIIIMVKKNTLFICFTNIEILLHKKPYVI